MEQGVGRKGLSANHRKVLILTMILALVGWGSLQAFRAVATVKNRPFVPSAILSASQTPHELTVASAPAALLAFHPANDLHTVEQALLEATGYTRARPFPGTIETTSAPDGNINVVVAIPVNVAYLLKRGEIRVGGMPGASSLKTGQLLISGNSTVYAVSMDAKTHIARFRFALAANDTMLWTGNWNANGIVSQNDSLN